jgi:hypothetical protein
MEVMRDVAKAADLCAWCAGGCAAASLLKMVIAPTVLDGCLLIGMSALTGTAAMFARLAGRAREDARRDLSEVAAGVS